MSKKKNKEIIKTDAANQQPTGNDNNEPEKNEGFFKKHWNGAKEKISNNKGLILGLLGGAAAAAGGLYYFGREDDITESNFEEATESEAEPEEG